MIVNLNGWDFSNINGMMGDEVRAMVDDTANWTAINSNRNDAKAMEWPITNCTGLYYKYFEDGRSYIKFENEQDAIMFKLRFG